ncbi:hypothetical protein [Soonwooa sp.]|uniref:hypothetical protein n=1 Tax=Soonwooa sp. TaxID=1938592 RepID=UPI0026359B8F|nr:hypothetical protein [Soonwooa sp.]
MKFQVKYPLVFATSFLWLGLVLAVSFLETPLKFQVPGMTLPIALELGKIMFGISTIIQIALLFIIGFSFLFNQEKPNSKILLNLFFLTLILILEKFWMLPVLDARADVLASGKGLPPTTFHDYFIYAEVAKVLLLFILPILSLEKVKADSKIIFKTLKTSH